MGNQVAFGIAVVVAASVFAIVVAYRYANIPAFGPIPSMYKPLWFAKEPTTAIADGTGALVAAIGFAHAQRQIRAR